MLDFDQDRHVSDSKQRDIRIIVVHYEWAWKFVSFRQRFFVAVRIMCGLIIEIMHIKHDYHINNVHI